MTTPDRHWAESLYITLRDPSGMLSEPVPEWTKFQVGDPNTSANWTNPDCQRLTSIDHVSHIELAHQILVNGRIKSGLVFDESKLREHRILVNWLSPNYWQPGSRYGNIRFTFNWAKLINNCNYYWVESINRYRPPAVRILITDQYRDSLLQRYDPTLGNGPWWYDVSSETHYWNGNYCLEIMLERDLLLTECTSIDFVKHHDRFSSIAGFECPDCGLSRELAGTRFLSAIVSCETDNDVLQWIEEGEPTTQLEIACSNLLSQLRVLCSEIFKSSSGPVDSTNEAFIPLSRAALGAYARQNEEEFKCLARLFKSLDDFEKGCGQAIASSFNLND